MANKKISKEGMVERANKKIQLLINSYIKPFLKACIQLLINSYIKPLLKAYNLSTIIKTTALLFIALIVLDDSDLPSKILGTINIFVVIAIACIIISILLFDFKLLTVLKLKTVNIFDFGILCIGLSVGVYSLILCFTKIDYKAYISFLFLVLTIVIIVRRIFFVIDAFKTVENNYINIHDLKELYDGNITNIKNLIYLEEKDVDYDLLERKNIIDNLYKTIIASNPNGKFVIGLEGAWGSGKTTIINNVKMLIKKNNPEIQIIDDFDPWQYIDQKSMISAMLDTILKSAGINYSVSSTNNLFSSFLEVLFDTNKYGKGIRAIGFHKQFTDIDLKNTKQMINDFLRLNNKNIVFIIDNIDRAEKDNILLLYKMVGTIFEFERITYILSFDLERVKKVLEAELGLDYDYMKKIIQLEIKVPLITKNIMKQLIEKSVENLLILYREDKKELEKYQPFFESVSSIIADVRELKRFLNSVISFNHKNNSYLNKIDSFSIEFIRFNNYTLYKSIWDNSQYYISHDKNLITYKFVSPLSYAKFNADGKEYFDLLFSDDENKPYKPILLSLFPYVKRYDENIDLESSYFGYSYEHAKIVINKSICSAKFFDLYFSQSVNEFIEISMIIENIVNLLNNSASNEDVWLALEKGILQFNNSSQKNLFEPLQFHLVNISSEGQLVLARLLFEKSIYFDDSLIFFQINALGRAEIIISDILIDATEDEYLKFVKEIEFSYDKIKLISRLHDWINSEKYNSSEDRENRSAIMKEMFVSMGRRIFDERISLYDESYPYIKGRIWGLELALIDDERDIKQYITKVLNEDSIFKFLFDITSTSHSSVIEYYIKISQVNIFTTVEAINAIIDKRPIKSQDEKFVLSIYEAFVNGKENSKRVIECDTYKSLKL